ncbi:MAG: hypothetical protein QM492_08655 [Rhodobacterales bacterium]
MHKKPYSKVGNTYYPKPNATEFSEDEVKGNYWRVWKDVGKVYFEYDAGHFATKIKTVEITESDFNLVKSGELTEKDLVYKYG